MPINRTAVCSALLCGFALDVSAQGAPVASAVSAAIDNVVYDVTFDRTVAPSRAIDVRMSFTTDGASPVILSLPAWTPGAYELSNFSRWVIGFKAASGETPLSWDKIDYDTWRVRPGGARTVAISFS